MYLQPSIRLNTLGHWRCLSPLVDVHTNLPAPITNCASFYNRESCGRIIIRLLVSLVDNLSTLYAYLRSRDLLLIR